MRQVKKSAVFLCAAMFSLLACGCAPAGQMPEEAVSAESPAGTEASTAMAESQEETTEAEGEESMMVNIEVNGETLKVKLSDNSSAEALKALLEEGPLTVEMEDYANMEKVGSLGTDLPRNDERITTGAGDVILYQGNQLVIYYAPNTWTFTRLGKVQDLTGEELYKILGSGGGTASLTLEKGGVFYGDGSSEQWSRNASGGLRRLPGNGS